MKAYRLQQGMVTRTEVPLPAVGPHDALIKITQASVCGTDIQIFQQDDWAKANVPDGTVIGHEGAGQIVALGEQAEGVFKIGDFVALESHYACDGCLVAGKLLDDCRAQGIVGVYGILQPDGSRAMPRSGVFAEYVSMPVTSLHHVPKELMENFQASLLEPAGNSWKIAQHFRTHGVPTTAGVFGCGPHGIFAQLFLKHIGVGQVIAVDPDAKRRAFASSFVADVTAIPNALTVDFLADQGILEIDAILDIAGVPGIIDQAIALVNPRGTVVLFGLPKSSEQNVEGIPQDKIIFESRTLAMTRKGKAVTVIGFNGRSVEGWKTLIAELTQSAGLRAKLMWPLAHIGTLEQLAGVIRDVAEGKPLGDHKLGMTGFGDGQRESLQ